MIKKISAKNLSVRLAGSGLFRTQEILHDISFELNEGDRLALIGPNGAGKSTLLHTIAGVLNPSAGEIAVQGIISALFHISVGQRRELTGRRNMVLKNLLLGHSYEEIMSRMDEMVAFAGIGDYIDRPLETYSQGMALRVAFAAATAFPPDILLMDEWLGVGDVAFRKKCQTRMKELVEHSGIIVLATHHQKLAEELCNRGLYLRGGRILAYGEVGECWRAYLKDSREGDARSGAPEPLDMDDDSAMESALKGGQS